MKAPDATAIRNVALVVPLLLVNTAAIYGQVMWADEHLARIGLAGAIGFACALESIGIFLAAEAHASLMAGDSSARLRFGSYAVALLVGALNYAHFAPSLDQPNPQALAFGAMSVISPWLWAIRSRSMSRAQLRAQGLIDGRAVKFTAAQWLLYPGRSFVAFRRAVWMGETNPDRARALTAPAVQDTTDRPHVFTWPDPIGPHELPDARFARQFEDLAATAYAGPPADLASARAAGFAAGARAERIVAEALPGVPVVEEPHTDDMLQRILVGIPDEPQIRLEPGDHRHVGYDVPIGPAPGPVPKLVKRAPEQRPKPKAKAAKARSAEPDPARVEAAYRYWQSNPEATGVKIAEIAGVGRATGYRYVSDWKAAPIGVSQ